MPLRRSGDGGTAGRGRRGQGMLQKKYPTNLLQTGAGLLRDRRNFERQSGKNRKISDIWGAAEARARERCNFQFPAFAPLEAGRARHMSLAPPAQQVSTGPDARREIEIFAQFRRLFCELKTRVAAILISSAGRFPAAGVEEKSHEHP